MSFWHMITMLYIVQHGHSCMEIKRRIVSYYKYLAVYCFLDIISSLGYDGTVSDRHIVRIGIDRMNMSYPIPQNMRYIEDMGHSEQILHWNLY